MNFGNNGQNILHIFINLPIIYLPIWIYIHTYLHGENVYRRMHKVFEKGQEEGRWQVKHAI